MYVYAENNVLIVIPSANLTSPFGVLSTSFIETTYILFPMAMQTKIY